MLTVLYVIAALAWIMIVIKVCDFCSFMKGKMRMIEAMGVLFLLANTEHERTEEILSQLRTMRENNVGI